MFLIFTRLWIWSGFVPRKTSTHRVSELSSLGNRQISQTQALGWGADSGSKDFRQILVKLHFQQCFQFRGTTNTYVIEQGDLRLQQGCWELSVFPGITCHGIQRRQNWEALSVGWKRSCETKMSSETWVPLSSSLYMEFCNLPRA